MCDLVIEATYKHKTLSLPDHEKCEYEKWTFENLIIQQNVNEQIASTSSGSDWYLILKIFGFSIKFWIKLTWDSDYDEAKKHKMDD